MALTYLNSQMIDMPLSVPTLSARTIQSPSINSASINSANVNVTNLSANNYYASSIFNDTDLFGDLTVHGNITSLSGLNIVSTFATTTSSLSVVNTGLGRALDVTQASNTEGIASFKGNNGEVVRISNNNPDVGQAGVAISWNSSGPALSAQGYSNFNTINASNINSTNITTTNARINNLNVDVITRLKSISATDIVTNNIILPRAGGGIINNTTFYGDISVLGRITSLSAIEIVSTSTTATSSLNIINAGIKASYLTAAFGISIGYNQADIRQDFDQFGYQFVNVNDYNDIYIEGLVSQQAALKITGYLDDGLSPAAFVDNVIEIVLTNNLERKTYSGFDITNIEYLVGAYEANVVVRSFRNSSGYVGYTVNGGGSVNITTVKGVGQTTGIPTTVGWATLYATRETASSNGALYLRVRGHTLADTATLSYYTINAVYLRTFTGLQFPSSWP